MRGYLSKALTLIWLMVALVIPSFGQTALTYTTLAAAAAATGTTVTVASATGIVAESATTGGTLLYVDREAMIATSVSDTRIGVRRGQAGTRQVSHASGASVALGAPGLFSSFNPSGSCTASATVATPWVNVLTGTQWICDSTTGNWLPVLSTGAITPAATAASVGVSAQTFTVSGLIANEPITVTSQPAPTALCPLVAARVTAANTVSLYFATLTAAACTPAAGTYMFTAPLRY